MVRAWMGRWACLCACRPADKLCMFAACLLRAVRAVRLCLAIQVGVALRFNECSSNWAAAATCRRIAQFIINKGGADEQPSQQREGSTFNTAGHAIHHHTPSSKCRRCVLPATT